MKFKVGDVVELNTLGRRLYCRLMRTIPAYGVIRQPDPDCSPSWVSIRWFNDDGQELPSAYGVEWIIFLQLSPLTLMETTHGLPSR